MKYIAVLAAAIVVGGLVTACGTSAPYSPVSATAPVVAPSSSSGSAELSVQIRQDAKLGAILTDSSGKTLYRFDRDDMGVSNCTGNCVQTWPPLLLASGAPAGPADIQGKLGIANRSDGGRQIMYGGAPLYKYAGDTQSGDTKGEGVGGLWHAERVQQAAQNKPAGGTSDGYGY